jgi:ribosomal protein L32E
MQEEETRHSKPRFNRHRKKKLDEKWSNGRVSFSEIRDIKLAAPTVD